ncbi:MAG: nucleotide-binding protein [Oscillospiraceae bacterium]|nr:nucleotide-binding protein [Oscillospiraceae bacterium]
MTGKEKLTAIIDEIDLLISKRVVPADPDFKAWHIKTERFLIKQFGENSVEVSSFRKTQFSLMVFALSTPQSEFIDACKHGLLSTKAILETYIEEFEDSQSVIPSNGTPSAMDFSSAFIVHGHDEGLKQAVARLLEKQRINAIILHEQPNQGATIIEKFEKNSDVGAAICLFTADDVGKAKGDSKENARARQNVVFEAGFFMGSLGRDHVILIADQGVELPSDLKGVVYSDSSSWQLDVLRELRAIGFQVDYNKLD